MKYDEPAWLDEYQRLAEREFHSDTMRALTPLERDRLADYRRAYGDLIRSAERINET